MFQATVGAPWRSMSDLPLQSVPGVVCQQEAGQVQALDPRSLPCGLRNTTMTFVHVAKTCLSVADMDAGKCCSRTTQMMLTIHGC